MELETAMQVFIEQCDAEAMPHSISEPIQRQRSHHIYGIAEQHDDQQSKAEGNHEIVLAREAKLLVEPGQQRVAADQPAVGQHRKERHDRRHPGQGEDRHQKRESLCEDEPPALPGIEQAPKLEKETHKAAARRRLR